MIDWSGTVADFSPRRTRFYRFGPFELDVRAVELRKHGIRLHLREQAFELLLLLLEHPGEIVQRAEIRDRLWPNKTVVEFDHGINTAIRRLRDILGDSAAQPRYIETVARRSYRFVAEVELVEVPSSELSGAAAPAASGSEIDPDDLEGTSISHYLVLDKLGSGGMGVVFRAKDINLNRNVALKFLPQEYSMHPQPLARFQQEARAAAALNHPNICTIYEIGEHKSRPFIAMELLEGQTLKDLLADRPLPLDEVRALAVQIAGALHTAHRRGIVHRDVKPANLYVTRQGQAKILDFGLAKLLPDRQLSAVHETVAEEAAEDSMTGPQTDASCPVGTVAYMSPEQVRGEDVGPRSDIFSLGVVLYEMAGGKPAFGGASSAETMDAILRDEPPVLPRSVPPVLDRIVRRCLEKEPGRRFQSATDLAHALESLSPSTARPRRPKRRAWWQWAAPLAACAAVGAVYFGRELRTSMPPAPPQTTLRRLTNNPDLTTDAAISPDGKLVAYVRNGNIWEQQVDGGGLIRITDDLAGDANPEFSPDGTQIAFRSARAGGGIYAAPILGGEARELVPQGRRPRFSPDGRWLMYWIGPNDINDDRYDNVRLFIQPLVAKPGGAATQIGSGCWVVDSTPVWSPDGSRILFSGSCRGISSSAWVATLDGKDLKPSSGIPWATIDQWIADPPRLLTRGMERVAVAIVAGVDANYITAVPVSADGNKAAGPPYKLTALTDNVTRVSAALNGRMAISVAANAAHIWGLPIDRNGHPTGAPTQLTGGSVGEGAPVLSGDGRKLAFLSRRANGVRLYYKDLATGREIDLSVDGHDYFSPAFNPDGTGIMYEQSGPGERNGLSFVSLSGGLSRKLWDKSTNPSPDDWSPDGKTVLYYKQDAPSKRWRGAIGVLDLDSMSATAFLEDPEFDLWEGHFSHDGRWVAFNSVKDNKSSRIFIAPFRKTLVPRSEWIAVTRGDWDDKPRFSVDGKLIFFVTGRDGPRRLWAQKLRSDMRPDGKPVAVYPPELRAPVISHDGISVGAGLVVFTRSESAGNIWLLEPARRD